MIKYWLFVFIVCIAVTGCKKSESNNITNERIIPLSPDEYGIYRDRHGNYYDSEKKWLALRTPDFEELLRLENITENVENLDIEYDNPITDIGFFGSLPKLKFLRCPGFLNIRDLEPLRYLHDLERMDLATASDMDVLPLKSLKNLKGIRLYCRNKFVNIDALSELENLVSLKLCSHDKMELKGIASLPKLKTLEILVSSEIDMAYIGTMQNLESLMVSSPNIKNLIGLKNPTLFSLDLLGMYDYESESSFYDGELNLDDLLNLQELKDLSVRRIGINDVTPLLKMKKLEKIYFEHNTVDIAPLARSNTIKKIHIDIEQYYNTPKTVFEQKGIRVYNVHSDDYGHNE
ncbi:MAG: hypothetical protein LBU85_01175 [Treponema sp.]|nr:hypothetical protein [Treponema sp.]